MVECEWLCLFISSKWGSRFNRYMVECEYLLRSDIARFERVLIDTWWNVNSVQQLCYFPVSSFNRYMVECEFYLNNCLVCVTD